MPDLCAHCGYTIYLFDREVIEAPRVLRLSPATVASEVPLAEPVDFAVDRYHAHCWGIKQAGVVFEE